MKKVSTAELSDRTHYSFRTDMALMIFEFGLPLGACNL
jgi:hypothetical protein